MSLNVPLAQSVHSSWPSLRDLPDGQAKHSDAPLFEVNPSEHVVQVVEPAPEKVPAAQDVHVASPSPLLVPGGHRSHDGAAAPENSPGEHGVWLVAPSKAT